MIEHFYQNIDGWFYAEDVYDDILKLNKWKPKPGSRELTDEEKELNSLYTTFIFKKI